MKAESLSVPFGKRPEMGWGSDAIAEVLSQLDLPYISLTPGASYRGLHDSLVNYLGNTKPEMVLCLHEEHAVAIAQGYAKVTGKPMAVALHSNVGLMHAAMAIFNAYCDRVPMVILGATGPLDATQRGSVPKAWVHTAADQGALIRNYCKWDDQPGSVAAAIESLIRANMLTRAHPSAPTYISLDAGMQESRLESSIPIPSLERYKPPTSPAPPEDLVDQTWNLLYEAERPLVLMGRVGRSQKQWDDRVKLVEHLGLCVVSDLSYAAVFPTRHRLHPSFPGSQITEESKALIQQADVILSLDWIDLGRTLDMAETTTDQLVISCTNDYTLHNGWSKDHFRLPAVDVFIGADPNMLVDALLAKSSSVEPVAKINWPVVQQVSETLGRESESDSILMSELATTLEKALGGHTVSWVGLPLGWSIGELNFKGPLDYLGRDGGAGIGSGPGIAVGASLALTGSGRIPVAVIGDGDYLMGSSALWTAAHHRLPLLVIVANNRSYYNDEAHQQRMAIARNRPVENRWIGQHLRDPDPDLATIARGHGLTGYGPVKALDDLERALVYAVGDVVAGKAALIDVWVSPRGYPGAP